MSLNPFEGQIENAELFVKLFRISTADGAAI